MERWMDLTKAAEREHGIVTYDQLLGAGLSERQVRRWVGMGGSRPWATTSCGSAGPTSPETASPRETA